MVTADVTFLTQPMPRALIPVVQLQAGEFELKTRRRCADQGGAHAGAAAGRGMDRSSDTFAGASGRARAPRRFAPMTTRALAELPGSMNAAHFRLGLVGNTRSKLNRMTRERGAAEY
jgi:hypothetical protein